MIIIKVLQNVNIINNGNVFDPKDTSTLCQNFRDNYPKFVIFRNYPS